MKFMRDLIGLSAFAGAAMAMSASAMPARAQSAPAPATSGYDADLAQALGADEYGMRSYVLVILKTGPAEITDETRRKELFAGHFANMKRLAAQEKLAVAGPFLDGGDMRGLYIFNVSEIAEAEALVMTDPAVAAGIYEAELTKFYGSAALLTIGDVHEKIQKKSVQ